MTKLSTDAVRRTLLMSLLFAALASGCGGGMCPVDGQVVWPDGSPAKEIAGSQIYFVHEEANSSALGEIGPDGTFHLMTNQPNDGSWPGKHAVYIVEKLTNADASGTRALPGIIDRKFYQGETSGLEVELTPGVNQVTIKIDRAAKLP